MGTKRCNPRAYEEHNNYSDDSLSDGRLRLFVAERRDYGEDYDPYT